LNFVTGYNVTVVSGASSGSWRTRRSTADFSRFSFAAAVPRSSPSSLVSLWARPHIFALDFLDFASSIVCSIQIIASVPCEYSPKNDIIEYLDAAVEFSAFITSL
jgi:hypothetical protein